MCGIAGCVAPPGQRPESELLERMAAALDHRGPDDHGIEIVDSVGLVHTRLSIVDPSPAGHGPMQLPGGALWLTYNGEIFNHLELRDELARERQIEWRGGSDTETLLNALAAWGHDAIGRCNGLYAYAALTPREFPNSGLRLVRDRFGVKPLYVARHQGRLLFASEMRALFAAGVPRKPRRDVLAQSIARGWANGPATPFEGIEKLLPGTVVDVDLETLETTERSWYAPAGAVDPERMASLQDLSRAEVARELEEALRASVHRRLMADVPVGTMCSGGLDSSLVAAFAREDHPRIVAFNASISDQPDVDEAPWAQQVTKALGIELHTVDTTAATWGSELVGVVIHNEYPLIHENTVPMSMIAKLAHSEGVKVLLSGEGSDELFGGYRGLHRAEYLDFLPLRWKIPQGIRALRERLDPRVLANRRRQRDQPSGGPVYDPAPPAEEVEFERDVKEAAEQAYAHHPGARGRLEAALMTQLGLYLPHLLNRQDKNTMQHSIETRVPFLDPDVVSLVLNVPLETRVGPMRKGILRDVGRAHLPAAVVQRPKIGFGFDVPKMIEPNARPEFLREGRLREVLEVPEPAWQEALAGIGSAQTLRLWTGEIWCRALLDGESQDTVEASLWAR